jgi:5'-deoxynucleotidase YfbR-like HD superfamily hydrolase
MLEAASGDVRRLSHVVRYSSIPVAVPENVAEHSYWVCLYSALIHQVLRPAEPELIGALLLKATVHDLAECVTGDVVRTFKYSSPSLRDEITKAEERIVRHLPGPVQVLMNGVVPNLVSGEGPYVEAVVKAADFMSLHQYMVREVRRGNREIIKPYYLRMEDDLRSMMERYTTLEFEPFQGLYKEMLETAKTARVGG